MKPFLGIDLTTDKKNEQFNGTEFLVMKPSSAMTQSFEQSSKKAEETIARGGLKKFVLKDLRVFYNSIEHAVDILKQTGLNPQIEQKEENKLKKMVMRLLLEIFVKL